MNDLIERLRSCARWGTMTNGFEASDRIEWMAADEIERLRDEVKKSHQSLTWTADENARLESELAEARELLREARDGLSNFQGIYSANFAGPASRIDAFLGEKK